MIAARTVSRPEAIERRMDGRVAASGKPRLRRRAGEFHTHSLLEEDEHPRAPEPEGERTQPVASLEKGEKYLRMNMPANVGA
jgi:hypothetical protein